MLTITWDMNWKNEPNLIRVQDGSKRRWSIDGEVTRGGKSYRVNVSEYADRSIDVVVRRPDGGMFPESQLLDVRKFTVEKYKADITPLKLPTKPRALQPESALADHLEGAGFQRVPLPFSDDPNDGFMMIPADSPSLENPFDEFRKAESAGLETTTWEKWCAAVERLSGLASLDGEQSVDGYSLDFAHDEFRKGKSPAEYVASIKPALRRAELKSAWTANHVPLSDATERLVSAYRYYRVQNQNRPAHLSYMHAAKDVAEGKSRYPESKLIRYTKQPETRATYFVDNASAIDGLRFHAYADECGVRSIRHTGWFLSEENITGETCRGVVYQLPGKNGKPRFIAGFQTSHDSDKNGATLDFSTIHDSADEAARDADQQAERFAETEREYQEAWQAGNKWSELEAELESTQTKLDELKAEMESHESALRDVPTAMEILENQIEAMEERLNEIKAERSDLEISFRNSPGFEEGKHQ